MRNIVSPLDGFRSPFGQRRGFSPSALFATGEIGAWYDPSDLTTMFQDSAGTTPVTAVEQPVGLVLDKSRGLARGDELVDTANTATAWTSFGTNTVAQDGDAVRISFSNDDRGAYIYLTQAGGLNSNLVAGKSYQLQVQLRVNTGSANFSIYGTSLGNYIDPTAITQTEYITRTYIFTYVSGNPNIQMSNLSTGEIIDIRNISVRELPGNHASQATSASRPVLSARVNLLTYSEQFNNAAWVKGGVDIPTTNATSPIGTATADLLVPTTVNTVHTAVQSITTPAASIVFSFYAKSGGYDFIQVHDGTSGTDYINFNLSTGAVGNSSGYTGTVTAAGSGWYLCAATKTFTAATHEFRLNPLDANTASRRPSYAGNGTSGIFIWGADLRVSNESASLPAYQRIAAATDYDTTGFPYYLRFDGTDDSLATAAIDFSATDKMSVFAGVRKLSDATQGVVAELSADINSNVGTFLLSAPRSGTNASYGFRSRGSVATNSLEALGFASPITNVVTGLANLPGDSMILRVTGVQGASSTEDQGTGNFGNYPLYLGRRGGSTLPLNGRLYSLIVLGRTATAAEITSTERWVGSKTGVVL